MHVPINNSFLKPQNATSSSSNSCELFDDIIRSNSNPNSVSMRPLNNTERGITEPDDDIFKANYLCDNLTR